ncbi:MAG: hypothetical protein HY370_02505 [Proteobacteria bacterium]|nr:hypothetical protein [Pseudomonadota bacterium]
MSGLRPGDAEIASFKGLDERYFDALKGAGDLSPEMLKTASETTTSIGKILRKAGFAYDHKDLATIRMIVGASLKANRKLAGTIAALTPAKQQIDRIHEIVSRMEVYAGHEERQTPQYKDALEEIDRLQQRLDSYRQKSGEMEDLENDLVAKRKEIKEQQEKVESGEQRAREINSAIDDMNGKIEAQMAELEYLKQRSDFQEMLRNNDELKEDVEKKGRQILDLKNQVMYLEDKRKREEESLKDAHRSEIAALKNRMRMIEGGLLVEKLESEVQSLREIAREAHDGIEQERELRKAFEDRVEIWVQNEEELKKDAEKWKKRAAFRYGFAAAACGIAALAGFSTGESSSLFAGTDVSLRWFYYTLIGGFATLGFFMGKGSGEKGIGAVVGGMVGLVAAFVGSIPIAAVVQSELNNKNKVVQQEREALLKDCQDAPCRLVKDKDGNFSVQVFTREYAGERVTFDLTDVKSPKFIRQSPLNRPQAAPAAQAP